MQNDSGDNVRAVFDRSVPQVIRISGEIFAPDDRLGILPSNLVSVLLQIQSQHLQHHFRFGRQTPRSDRNIRHAGDAHVIGVFRFRRFEMFSERVHGGGTLLGIPGSHCVLHGNLYDPLFGVVVPRVQLSNRLLHEHPRHDGRYLQPVNQRRDDVVAGLVVHLDGELGGRHRLVTQEFQDVPEVCWVGVYERVALSISDDLVAPSEHGEQHRVAVLGQCGHVRREKRPTNVDCDHT